MKFKQTVYASTLAAGVGIAGLFGAGMGAANADPGQPCNAPNAPACQPGAGPQNNGPQGNNQNNGPQGNNQNNGPQGNNQNNGPQGNDWQNRGINQGRQDRQPFNYNGKQVQPMPAGNGSGWGFWFLGQWVPL